MTTDFPSLIARRRIAVAIIYALSLFWGAESRFDPAPLTGFLTALTCQTVMALFCMLDARIRGRPLPWSVPWLIFLSWPIFVPAYLFWTRGRTRILSPVLYILAFLAAPFAGYHIVATIASLAAGSGV